MGTATRWLYSVWRTLGSSRLAVILLIALLLASLLTSLFPQMPADGSTEQQAPTARQTWLAAAALRYGPATGLLHGLGLFNVYRASWFLALLAALVLNTFACTIQRLPRLWRSLTKQGRWTRAGTLVSHVAAPLLVITIAARPALSWQETGVMLLPGQIYPVGHRHGFAVQPGTLILDRYPDGQPRDYRVPLTVLVDSSPVLTRTVRINHPLTFRGIAFHLQSYGPAARLATPEGTFDLAFSGVQAQEVTLPEAGFTLRVACQPEGTTLFVEALAADGSLLGSGIIADGQEIEIQGTPVTSTLSRYTVWQISRDPTFGLALGSAGLLLAAVLASLWVPQRPAWPRLGGEKARPEGEGDG